MCFQFGPLKERSHLVSGRKAEVGSRDYGHHVPRLFVAEQVGDRRRVIAVEDKRLAEGVKEGPARPRVINPPSADRLAGELIEQRDSETVGKYRIQRNRLRQDRGDMAAAAVLSDDVINESSRARQPPDAFVHAD
jgi:hypothetical protein